MATTNYSFTTINPSDSIDIAKGVNTPLQQIDTALKTVDDKTSVNSASISSLSSKVDGISELVSNSDILVIGDSWSAPSKSTWSTVGKMMNAAVHNYAVSGTGFMYGNQTFQQQLEKAASEVDTDKIGLVCIYGLSNDYANGFTSAGQFTNAINNLGAYIKEHFQHARGHMFFNNRFKYGSNWVDHGKQNSQIKLAIQLANTAFNAGIVAHPNSICWIGYDAFSEDFTHPTDANYTAIARYITAELTGASYNFKQTNMQNINLQGNDNITGNGTLIAHYDLYTVYFTAYVNLTSDFNTSAKTFTLEDPHIQVGMWAPQTEKKSNMIGLPLIRTDGTGSGNMPIQFKDNGDAVYLSQVFAGSAGLPPMVAGAYTGYASQHQWG